MHSTHLGFARQPIERVVTTRTPHLVTPVYLLYGHRAFRTIFGGLLDKRHRFHVVRITHMVLCFDRKA